MPRPANCRRHCPARLPSDGPNGAHRKPRTSRCAMASSPGSSPRQSSSIKMAQVQGSSPWRRRARRRLPAERPRRASIEYGRVEQDPRHVSRCDAGRRVGGELHSPDVVIPFVALVEGIAPSAASISSHRRSSSSPRRINSAMNALRRLLPSPLVEFGNELVVNGYVQSHV